MNEKNTILAFWTTPKQHWLNTRAYINTCCWLGLKISAALTVILWTVPLVAGQGAVVQVVTVRVGGYVRVGCLWCRPYSLVDIALAHRFILFSRVIKFSYISRCSTEEIKSDSKVQIIVVGRVYTLHILDCSLQNKISLFCPLNS